MLLEKRHEKCVESPRPRNRLAPKVYPRLILKPRLTDKRLLRASNCVVPAEVEGNVHGGGGAGRQGDWRQSVQDQHRRPPRQQQSEGKGGGTHQGRHGQSVERRHRPHC